MKENATFAFSAQDSLAQFMVWLLVLGAGTLPLPLIAWWFGGTAAAIASILTALAVLIGLRTSIVVTPSQVVITRRWFFIPYWRYTGPAIEDAWFGGDWGEAEGASGVVVQLNGKEIHIGSRKTMHHLHASLLPMRAPRVARQGVQSGGRASGGPAG